MIVDVTTMRANDDAAFRAADERVQSEFFYQQPGLVRRTTAQAADGEWAVVTLWAAEEHAAAARAAFTGHDFWNVVDAASVQSRQYTTLD